MSDRQKLFYALLASAFIHIAIGLVLASWTAQHSSEVARALPDLRQLTVTIMPPKLAETPATPTRPPPVIVPTPAPMPPVLDSDGLTPSKKAAAKALFQSDANMIAGSLLPATGNLPLPSQAGPKRNFTDFANQPGSFGKGQTPMAPSRAPSAPQSAQAMPEQTPYAITQVQHAPTPKPAPTAAPDTLALGTPTPTPIEQLARLTTPPPMRGHAEMAPMTRPSSAPPRPPSPSVPEPSMQRQIEKTRVDGGITAPGPAGVDAIETPFGRYHHKLSNLIGSRWQLYLQEHPKDIGDVTILVKLNPNGKVAATRVVANHALDDLAELSTRAIMESDLPPVPDDLAPMLRDGKLEITFNFNVYDPNKQ